MAKRSELTKNYVFLTKNHFRLRLSFLGCKNSHLFIGSLEDSRLPEVIFFPDLTLVDFRYLIE